MSEFVVEKNVPVQHGAGAPHKYPFHDMEVGDSFAIPADKFARVKAAAYAHARNHGRKFSTSEKHLRCWRVA